MIEVTAKALTLSSTAISDPEVIRTEYELDDLVVTVRSLASETEVSLSFSSVIGFRVMDERDLLEFWAECSAHGPVRTMRLGS